MVSEEDAWASLRAHHPTQQRRERGWRASARRTR